MKGYRTTRGLTLLEVVISTTILTLIMYGIVASMDGIQRTLEFQTSRNAVESGATRLMDQIGRDIRESSYAYVHAGDWFAFQDAGGTDIEIARNYFSSNPFFSGATLVPGITKEGWAQCLNDFCGWSSTFGPGGSATIRPNSFLAQPVRNNYQGVTPVYPPVAFQFSNQDAKGRMYCHLSPGDACPECGWNLSAEAYFSGLMLLSPRLQDNSFSYVGGTNEVQWESIIFYCPFRISQGASEMRRYVFYASMYNPAANLIDLMDFDGNGLIENPPMTDVGGDFVLDAEGEYFCLQPLGGPVDSLIYFKWDNGSGRFFQIDINRATGVANVLVTGGPFGTGVWQTIPLVMRKYAWGISDFEVSTFINNPSWDAGGAIVNPNGVAELGAVRVTLQIDRSQRLDPNQRETIQTTMFRPRN
ncbi:MAG: PulJ/GspJ family protein [Planctomycetota bacterium]|jgi:hypothetical protein